MDNFDCIIPLGETCNVTFLLQNNGLKRETTLFEWFASPSLNNITDIISKLVNNSSVEIKQHGENIFVGGVNIFSKHYREEEYKQIFARRSERFLNSIKSKNRILFVRVEDNKNTYSYDDIDRLLDTIKCINPNTEGMKLLIIRGGNLSLEHPFLIVKNIDDCHLRDDPLFNRPAINKIFIDTLNEVGYNCNNTTTLKFDDKSDT